MTSDNAIFFGVSQALFAPRSRTEQNQPTKARQMDGSLPELKKAPQTHNRRASAKPLLDGKTQMAETQRRNAELERRQAELDLRNSDLEHKHTSLLAKYAELQQQC